MCRLATERAVTRLVEVMTGRRVCSLSMMESGRTVVDVGDSAELSRRAGRVYHESAFDERCGCRERKVDVEITSVPG
jgi:hypothetical protein